MRVKRFSLLFVIMLALSSFFASFAFAEDNNTGSGSLANQILGNSSQSPVTSGEIPLGDQSIFNNVDLNPFDDDFSIDLTASPTEQTKGPVTITVKVTDNEAHTVIEGSPIKWLQDTKTKEDFKSAGNAVQGSSFQVTENGTYTVYVYIDETVCGCIPVELVKTIDINNIIKEEPTPTPTPTPTAPTVTPVAAAPVVTPVAATVTTNPLPNTATPMYNFLPIGLILILAGISVLVIQKSRTRNGKI